MSTELGAGTTFRVFLPKAAGEEALQGEDDMGDYEQNSPLKIKGVSLLGALESLRLRRGPLGVQELLERMDPKCRPFFNGSVLLHPAGWYPLDVFTEFLRSTLAPEEPPTLLVMRSEGAVERQLRGIYSMFVKLGSPQFILKRMAAVHRTYFRGVDIEVTELERNRATIRYRGFRPAHRLLEHVIVGFYRKALELSGASQLVVACTAPVGSGSHAEFTLRWR